MNQGGLPGASRPIRSDQRDRTGHQSAGGFTIHQRSAGLLHQRRSWELRRRGPRAPRSMVEGLDAPCGWSATTTTSSIVLDSRMRSRTLRSRIWVVRSSVTPSFSSRARTRRTLSPVRSAIASISCLDVRLLGLDLLGLGDLGQEEELLERLQGRLVGIGPDLGLAGPDVVVRQALLAQLPDQPTDRVCLLPGDQIGGEVERRLREQLIQDLPAQRLPLLGLEPAFEDLANGLAQAYRGCRTRSRSRTPR